MEPTDPITLPDYSSPNYSNENPSFFSKLGRNFFELFEFIAIVGAILIVIRFFVAEPHKVSGRSMVPNFQDGDYIITNKMSLRLSNLERGEVVILHDPRDTDKVFIKRIIGLPGERIKLLEGKVYINNNPISESYLPEGVKTQGESFLTEDEEITIPDNQYFVLGDNRGGSSDSREWGTVKKELVIGQAWFRYWPIPEFGLIKVDASSY